MTQATATSKISQVKLLITKKLKAYADNETFSNADIKRLVRVEIPNYEDVSDSTIYAAVHSLRADKVLVRTNEEGSACQLKLAGDETPVDETLVKEWIIESVSKTSSSEILVRDLYTDILAKGHSVTEAKVRSEVRKMIKRGELINNAKAKEEVKVTLPGVPSDHFTLTGPVDPQGTPGNGNSEPSTPEAETAQVTDESPISEISNLPQHIPMLNIPNQKTNEPFVFDEGKFNTLSNQIKIAISLVMENKKNFSSTSDDIVVALGSRLNGLQNSLESVIKDTGEVNFCDIKKMMVDIVDTLSVIQMKMEATPSNDNFRDGYRLGFKDGIEYTRKELSRPL
jgi:hypothetical protein